MNVHDSKRIRNFILLIVLRALPIFRSTSGSRFAETIDAFSSSIVKRACAYLIQVYLILVSGHCALPGIAIRRRLNVNVIGDRRTFFILQLHSWQNACGRTAVKQVPTASNIRSEDFKNEKVLTVLTFKLSTLSYTFHFDVC